MKYIIRYKLLSETGMVVDEDTHFEFIPGDGQLALGLESCVLECEVDRLQTFLLAGDDIFGQYDETACRLVSFDELPEDIEQGSAIDFALPSGEEIIGTIKELTDEGAVIDFNHPLSGVNISFIIKVLAIEE